MRDSGTRSRDADALSYLIGTVGWPGIASIGALMILASFTEGIGLLMLVPITQIVAEEGS
ncbi:hypothetical protein [Altererythrobacter sp. TH136]|uniref:hypothetical protein n=1 Tax=Altererythrobacter sp. TH136 TaxID=2067415 RepID=UPI0011641207|nr:hypothetical protein [Altererythrobacter sp. TH136]QDM41811.1 hypothetical protein C0V74_12745 [Altererythrobacter sp. TH136]